MKKRDNPRDHHCRRRPAFRIGERQHQRDLAGMNRRILYRMAGKTPHAEQTGGPDE